MKIVKYAFALMVLPLMTMAESGSWPERMVKLRSVKKEVVEVNYGQWYSTKMVPCKNLKSEIAFSKNFDLNTKDTAGKPIWSLAKWMKDGQVIKLNVGNSTAGYFYRTITTSQACKRTFSFGSDDGITVWFNGKQVVQQDVMRGCAADQAVATVALKKGINATCATACDAATDKCNSGSL